MAVDTSHVCPENFAAVKIQEWVAICRHVTAVEEEYLSREDEVHRITDRIITAMKKHVIQ